MLYHFEFDLSDIDRGVYETLDFRTAQHPSETAPYLLTRALAYALSYREGLEFTPGGLNDPDGAALHALGEHGSVDLWIEIGNPSARKLHKASKATKQLAIYTYKNPELLLEEVRSNNIHRSSEFEIYAFDPKFLQSLEKHLEKNNRWTLLFQEGQLDVSIGEERFVTEVKRVL